MKLAAVVAASQAVAATRSRKKKAAALAALLQEGRALRSVLVPWLSGELPQGRIGIGWATLRAVGEVPPAGEATLGVSEVDEAFGAMADISGRGSKARREAALAALLARATPAEQAFLRALLSGELRQGAQAGVVAEGESIRFDFDDDLLGLGMRMFMGIVTDPTRGKTP